MRLPTGSSGCRPLRSAWLRAAGVVTGPGPKFVGVPSGRRRSEVAAHPKRLIQRRPCTSVPQRLSSQAGAAIAPTVPSGSVVSRDPSLIRGFLFGGGWLRMSRPSWPARSRHRSLGRQGVSRICCSRPGFHLKGPRGCPESRRSLSPWRRSNAGACPDRCFSPVSAQWLSTSALRAGNARC